MDNKYLYLHHPFSILTFMTLNLPRFIASKMNWSKYVVTLFHSHTAPHPEQSDNTRANNL